MHVLASKIYMLKLPPPPKQKKERKETLLSNVIALGGWEHN